MVVHRDPRAWELGWSGPSLPSSQSMDVGVGRQRVVWRYMLPDVEQPVNFKPRSPLTAHQALGHPWPDITGRKRPVLWTT